MVAVEVRDADAVQVVGRDTGAHHLPLGALAGVEEDALAVPAQHVAVVVTVPGRHLARGAQDDQFTYGQLAYPGGQLRPRPPRTCACAWKTVWPAPLPVLKTIQ